MEWAIKGFSCAMSSLRVAHSGTKEGVNSIAESRGCANIVSQGGDGGGDLVVFRCTSVRVQRGQKVGLRGINRPERKIEMKAKDNGVGGR